MEQTKTGTTTLGIICKDGIVMAADKRVTAGSFIPHKDFEKVIQVNDNIVVTVSGSVSDVQMFVKLFRAELKLKSIKSDRIINVKEAANFAARIAYDSSKQYFQTISHLIIGGYDNSGTKMYEVNIDGAMFEIKEYVSTGSGSIIVYGILENSYKDSLTVKDGEDLAFKCISAAIQRDSGSGNGVDVITITKDSIRKTVQKKSSGTYV